jgi:hypothetical protein
MGWGGGVARMDFSTRRAGGLRGSGPSAPGRSRGLLGAYWALPRRSGRHCHRPSAEVLPRWRSTSPRGPPAMTRSLRRDRFAGHGGLAGGLRRDKCPGSPVGWMATSRRSRRGWAGGGAATWPAAARYTWARSTNELDTMCRVSEHPVGGFSRIGGVGDIIHVRRPRRLEPLHRTSPSHEDAPRPRTPVTI